MAKYRVEVCYVTKRGGTCCGMTVDAFRPDEAGQTAEDKVLKGYPARKWASTSVSSGHEEGK